MRLFKRHKTNINVGIQECRKCKNNLRCEECVYPSENKTLKTENENYSHNIRNLTAESMQLQAEIKRLEKVQVQYVKAYFDEFAERLKNDFRIAQLYPELMSEIIDELVETMKNEFVTLEDFTELIKVKAYKEFWGELKKRNTMDERIVSVASGDNLLKEMVGETDEAV